MRSRKKSRHNKEIRRGQLFLDAVLVLLSFVVLGMLFIETIIDLPAQTQQIFHFIDTFICIVFISEFFIKAFFAPNRGEYLKWGWIDLICSIPNLDVLRWGRLLFVFRFLHILRGIRSLKLIIPFILQYRSRNIVLAISSIAGCLIIFSVVVILRAEADIENSRIRVLGDAIWWAFVTMTTTGYGDFYPVSVTGRVIAIFLMITGLAVMSTFTAYISSSFFIEKEHREIQNLSLEMKALRKEISELTSKLAVRTENLKMKQKGMQNENVREIKRNTRKNT